MEMKSKKKAIRLIGIIITVIATLIISVIMFVRNRPWIAGDVASDIGEQLPGVSLSIEEGSLTREGANFSIHNESAYQIRFCWTSLNTRLQVLQGEEWRYINSLGQTAIGCINSHNVSPDESVMVELNWSRIYGRLRNGRYRFVDVVFIIDYNMNTRYEQVFNVVYEFDIK